MEKKGRFGPGFLVAAAFIGPGTVISASRAGAIFGYQLIWIVVISTLAAIVLQEMVGRFSLSTKIDIASALVKFTKRRWVRMGFQVLGFLAIVVGCAAYEAGNITGGGLGLNILSGIKSHYWVILISIMAAALLLWRNYKIIEKILISLVVIMGISFFVSGIVLKPNLSEMIAGFIPKIPIIPESSVIYILALLGTTVVPYNLFLHSSTLLKKWNSQRDIPLMRKDAYLSIGLGGLITISIIVTATVVYQGVDITNAADLSLQLKPALGKLAKLFIGIGLFAAGLSSAITAPYAAAWTAAGLFGLKETSWKYRSVFLTVICFGAFVSLTAIKPLQLILLAQVTNAFLLPIVAIFIIYLLNKKEVGKFKNTIFQNILFIIVFIIIVLINLKKII